ncbi:putative beta-galactosidase E [Teratosphaeria destructans]|uniref:Beta-galactosidase n=1 Tax=Teratosphaeria destructans TaxID=418781 RepID=A0A9W7SXH6_9PEZI|nr:putative beta-galactosidase E [Teratosphaeria destructans]
MIPFTSLVFILRLLLVGVDAFSVYDHTSQSSPTLQNQSLVTWDEHSFMIRGERLFLFSGEFHPFRLPVPGLWLDVFQKIKAMGFNCVSFYTDWALLEGEEGEVVTDGIWSLDDFFAGAAEAGIYLIARPGPYINAETAAGGMPGWTLRLNETLRSDATAYTDATRLYLSTVGRIIANAQITNGGPVILVQPENEYSTWPDLDSTQFPAPFNRDYMAFVKGQLRDAGIVVPFISNDNKALGYWAPGTGEGSVDVYGIDAYPMRYDCAHPDIWPTYRFPRDWDTLHQNTSPSTPFVIAEFQGGSGTGWGPDSVNQDGCNALVNEESVRVLFKNNYSFGVKLLNIYMIYGGTNWGNLGYEGGDSSYDYGAAITEDRHVWREKYSEQKLEANFLRVSPAYLTAIPGKAENGSDYVPNMAIAATALSGTDDLPTRFYVVRHADFTSLANTTYMLNVPTSQGDISIPQLGGRLSLNGRDSKVHVTDYDVGGINLVYSTAEIFTWAKDRREHRRLILYGGAGETHEFAIPTSLGLPTTGGPGLHIEAIGSTWVVQWQVQPARQIVRFGGLEVQLLWRNDAYRYWVLELPAPSPVGNYSSLTKDTVIVRGGYLLHTAALHGASLELTGDLNATTQLTVEHEPTGKVESIVFNGERLNTTRDAEGKLTATIEYRAPEFDLPDLNACQWKYVDSLPEVSPTYEDSDWTECDHQTTTNDQLGLRTPTSLFASDYGYHTGSLIYRGHFLSSGDEHSLFLNISGGSAHGFSVWLNSSFLGSWAGNVNDQTYSMTFDLPSDLPKSAEYVFTVLIDHMGQNEEAPGTDDVKFPFGILDYSLDGHEQQDLTWKLTGNLGGEHYRDKVRGPRNEGAMYAERQGYHLPAPPSENWITSSPVQQGLSHAGVGFYSTWFNLSIPEGYDVPISFVFNDDTYGSNDTIGRDYRVQFFVNGYQFGKYIHNLGPQTSFPVPEGILNYRGVNWLALTLWALQPDGARLDSIALVAQMPVVSGYQRPSLAPQPRWSLRRGMS